MSEQGRGPGNQDLDLIPAIAPEKDELDSRRRNLSAPKQSNFRGLLVFCLVLMAAVLGVGGFTLFEVQQRLNQSNELLEQARQSVQDLEARLAATGTDVSKELRTLKEQQATNFSEIDKLWRVAYRENRPNIKKLENSFKDMALTNEKLSTEIIALRSEVDRSGAAFKSLSDTMNQTRENLLAENEELKTSISLVRGQVQDQAVESEAAKRNVATINRSLKEIQEAIDAIDRYRAQINQRVLKLENPATATPGGE